ncbi:hypothetical protein BDK51DRAFT_12680, partial [Blyttiomyces helicus]
CTTPLVRREFRELSEADRQGYLQAVLCLRSSPSRLDPSLVQSPSAWDDLVWAHWQAQDQAHNTAAFPPWHRVFLAIYDAALQTCNWTNGPVYYDWSHDSQAPEQSEIWSDKYFGGNGSPDPSGCIQSGPFSNIQATFPTPHCVNRQFQTGSAEDPSNTQYGDMIGAQFSPVELEFIIDVSDYDSFRQGLEAHPHNQFHTAVGGDLTDPRTSVNDPIFFSHHCNIDRWYWKWQQANPSTAHTYAGNTNPQNPGTEDAQITDMLTFYGMWPDTPVSQAVDPQANGLCYTYSKSIAPASITDPIDETITGDLQSERANGPVAGQGGPGGPSGPDGPVFGPGGPQSLAKRDYATLRSGFNAYKAAQSGSYGSSAPPRYQPNYVKHAYGPKGHPSNPHTPHPYDRDDQYNLRHHQYLDEGFLRRMNYDDERIAKIRYEEDHLHEFVDYVNAVDGFVS